MGTAVSFRRGRRGCPARSPAVGGPAAAALDPAARAPTIPNRFTQAPAREEALVRVAAAAAGLLASFAAHDEEIPVKAPGAVVETIDVAVPVAALT